MKRKGLKSMLAGLGPGQLVGRQVLGSPVLGDIQLSLCDKRGNLEVEVIRARGLQSKPGSKLLPGSSLKFTFLPALSSSPAPWVKVYLVSGKKCLAKAKTSAARRTLDPLFQQQLIFHQRYGGCVLQVALVAPSLPFCKSLLCSMFNKQTCSRFTRLVVTMPKLSLKPL